MTEKELQEKRAQCWSRMQEIMDTAKRENRDLTAEERVNWDAAEADLSGATKDLADLASDKDRRSRQAALEAESRGGKHNPAGDAIEIAEQTRGDNPEDAEKRISSVFNTFMRRGMEGIKSPEDRALMQARYEERAEGVASGAAGGYLVPQGFWDNLVVAMKAYGGLLNYATVIDTSTGAPLPWPNSDDTSNVGSILGENTQVSNQDIVFSNKTLNAYTYTSNLILCSLQLLQDSAFDVESFVKDRASERIGRAVAQHLVTGTGTNQPQSVLATGAITNNVTLPNGNGNTTGLTYAGLVALAHKIDPAYRTSGNARFLMSDTALAAVRLIVDGQGRPLWQPDFIAGGDGDRIMGYPVSVDQGIPTPAANAVSVVFGDFKAGYVVRRALGLQLMTLRERYADYLQVGFVGFMRLDGKVNDPRALATLTQSAT